MLGHQGQRNCPEPEACTLSSPEGLRLLPAGKDSERITERSHIGLSRDHDPPREVGLGADTLPGHFSGGCRV